MRLHRLRVESFAAIREVDIAFGPGLNVLYGPNDLGKSTLADAIRLVLLLPHTSKDCEPYVPWSGGHDPIVELTFATEEQRFWRVRKEFGKSGSAVLQESRNGQDFEDVQRARGVDARVREVLRWGISEPGGTGAGKGLPTSFLATALLSTQGDVADVLHGSLQEDPTGTGKERIAAALQAVAQDPLFATLLREVQERRDEAYTDKGARKTARGSVFKVAADRLRETREEKERLQKTVEESDGVERHLQELAARRDLQEEALAAAADRLSVVEQLAKEAADLGAAFERVNSARGAVLRIQRMDDDVAVAEERLGQLGERRERCEVAWKDAEAGAAAASETLKAVEGALSTGTDRDMADTVARQGLELRKVAGEQAARAAQRDIEAANQAQALVEAASQAEDAHRKQQQEADRARERHSEATAKESAESHALRRCDLLERVLEVRLAAKQVESAEVDVERHVALQADLTNMLDERTAAAELRGAMSVPLTNGLTAMRRLATELASARGALDVGLVMTVTPAAPVDLRIRADGATLDQGVIANPFEIEANTEVEIRIADLVTIGVRGGRRDAQETVRSLQDRWDREVLPHLTAAGANDLDALDAKLAEARALDARIARLNEHLESLQRQLTELAGAPEALRQASAHAQACQFALGDVEIETLAADLDALGADPGATLRKHRDVASQQVERARAAAVEAGTEQSLAEERARSLGASLETAVRARDAALSGFTAGVTAAAAVAQESLRESIAEQERVTEELASLQSTIDALRRERQQALVEARQATDKARESLEAAQQSRTMAITDHASEQGSLTQLRSLRAAEDLAAAELALREATEQYDALPVPERAITPEEVSATQTVVGRAQRDLAAIEQEIQRTQGALQQVGGRVASDRLREANEAFELAERQERETEADYEAWKLLLEQMKEADAAQASNLGQALAPAIAEGFAALTEQRYQGIQLTAHLNTDGVVLAGTVRPPARISVGTREQLSTLYRLCLGEYLRTTVVLDDQLVQSDHHRMDWFRALLAEKAHSFQIIVLTCRPGDYLAAAAMVPQGGPAHADFEGGLLRAIDLGRAVLRR